MADADDPRHQGNRHREVVSEMVKLGPLPGQCGVVVAHGDLVISADIMGNPALFAACWEPLIRSNMSERPAFRSPIRSYTAAGVALMLLRRMGRSDTPAQPAVGLGEERHLAGRGYIGQALTLAGATVHATACFTGPA